MADAPTPNPGSDEALELGCRCPVLHNAHGRGAMGTSGDDAEFWTNAACPLHGATTMPDPSPDTPSVCPRCGSPDPGKPWRQVGFGKTDPCQHPWHKATATPPPSRSPTPDTAALVAELREVFTDGPYGSREWDELIQAGADALEAQAARIAELEAHNRRLATTMTGDTATDLRVLYAYELGIADHPQTTPAEETTE